VRLELGRFVLRRLAQAAVTIVCIATLNFLLVHLAPGDAVDVLAGEAGAADARYVAELREKFGLDQPIAVQLGRYLSRLVRLDLGHSFRHQVPVFQLILQRLSPTLLLMVASLSVAFVGGLVLGVTASTRARSPADYVISVLALLAYATPLFWLGLMLIVLLTLKLGLLPAGGMYTIGATQTPLAHALDVLRHLLLPATTLALFYMATYTRLMRASMLEVLGSDFVRTAHAKGLRERTVMTVHALRNALIPVVTALGGILAALIGGALVIEQVFSWPGIGRFTFAAAIAKDYPVVQAGVMIAAVLLVISNILRDIAYAVVDPRISVK
jgi:peptide/nickel transport system permease protein